MAIGKLSWLQNQVAIIGGNCSITVLDCEGNEVYWTVMGDIVRSIAVFDFDGDGENEVFNNILQFQVLYPYNFVTVHCRIFSN